MKTHYSREDSRVKQEPPYIRLWWPSQQALCGACGGAGTKRVAYTTHLPFCEICKGNGVVRIVAA